MADRSLKTLQPGRTLWLEHGLFAYRTKAGEIRFGISYSAHGRRVREMVGGSKTLAKNVLAKRRAEIVENRFEFPTRRQSPTVSEFCDTYMAHAKLSKRSWLRDAGVIKKLKTFFPSKRLSGISTFDIEAYRRKSAESVTRASTNREVAIVRHMLALAVKWGVIENNPALGVKLFREEERAVRVLNDEEQAALLAACTEHLRSIVVLALSTGLRRGEALSLSWQDVNLRERVITVQHSKSGRVRHIPLNSTVCAVLEGIPGPRSGNVFKWQGNPILSVTRSFRTAIKRSGIRPCRFHDLRHTFATRLVLAGVDIVTVKELLGHRDICTTMRYSHPSPESKRRAVELLSIPDTSGRSVADGEKVADGGEAQVLDKYGTPGRNRTDDTRFRKPLLYPSELRGHRKTRSTRSS